MRTIIAGSRDFSDYALLSQTLDGFKGLEISEIVSGGANGTDALGEKYANEKDIALKVFPADWTLGKGAGHMRNAEMALYTDTAIIFWDSESKGTKNMIEQMKKIKKPCVIIRYNEKDLEEW